MALHMACAFASASCQSITDVFSDSPFFQVPIQWIVVHYSPLWSTIVH